MKRPPVGSLCLIALLPGAGPRPALGQTVQAASSFVSPVPASIGALAPDKTGLNSQRLVSPAEVQLRMETVQTNLSTPKLRELPAAQAVSGMPAARQAAGFGMSLPRPAGSLAPSPGGLYHGVSELEAAGHFSGGAKEPTREQGFSRHGHSRPRRRLQEGKFENPLMKGADPWVTYKDGYYYYTQTLGDRIEIRKTADISRLADAPATLIFRAHEAGPQAAHVWAPELHFIDGKWYVYFAAGTGDDPSQRMWVLENDNPDPTQGKWVDRGRIYSSDADFWAIDGTILEHEGARYFVWSGRPDPTVQDQNLYIARMTSPWTLGGPAAILSRPELPWETNGAVNEGPAALRSPAGRVFVTYSASGFWTDDYALGMLSLREGGDPMNPADWTKSQEPVFSKSPESGAYGPGHNSFFRTPDGKEYWIMYHAKSRGGQGGEDRNVRMQRFTFDEHGLPKFGAPARIGQPLPSPSRG